MITILKYLLQFEIKSEKNIQCLTLTSLEQYSKNTIPIIYCAFFNLRLTVFSCFKRNRSNDLKRRFISIHHIIFYLYFCSVSAEHSSEWDSFFFYVISFAPTWHAKNKRLKNETCKHHAIIVGISKNGIS